LFRNVTFTYDIQLAFLLDQKQIVPERHYYEKGKDVQFTCKTAVPGTTQWYFNNKKLPPNARIVNNKQSIIYIYKLIHWNVKKKR